MQSTRRPLRPPPPKQNDSRFVAQQRIAAAASRLGRKPATHFLLERDLAGCWAGEPAEAPVRVVSRTVAVDGAEVVANAFFCKRRRLSGGTRSIADDSGRLRDLSPWTRATGLSAMLVVARVELFQLRAARANAAVAKEMARAERNTPATPRDTARREAVISNSAVAAKNAMSAEDAAAAAVRADAEAKAACVTPASAVVAAAAQGAAAAAAAQAASDAVEVQREAAPAAAEQVVPPTTRRRRQVRYGATASRRGHPRR